jgi:CheY-like chemotaxis protein
MNSDLILLVEDSPEDFETTVRALRKAGLVNAIHRCEDGEEALDYLHRRGAYADPAKAPRPALVMLDLNLPGTDGRQVLDDIKTTEHLKKTPVIVLTTSTDERDIDKCYRMGANSYIKKPVDLEGFLCAIERFKDYWFGVVVLPRSA